MNAIVIYDLFNYFKQTYVEVAEIVPLKTVKYKLVSPYEGGKLEDGYKEQGLTPIFLSTWQKTFVINSLIVQNLSHYDYIESVTVHSMWKHQWHQGIIFARKQWTKKTCEYVANTRSDEAIELVKKLIKNI